jgi:CDP-paratose 2-epimerase
LAITGGAGFLGINLAIEGLARGADISLFDNLSRAGANENLEWAQRQGAIRFVHGDIRCGDDVSKFVEMSKPDVIFHLAGQVAMTTSIANPRKDFQINAAGTVNLLEAVRREAPEATVIYSSTNKVYGDLEQYSYKEDGSRYVCLEHPNGFDEATPLSFGSPYGCSKGAADQYMLDYARIFGLKTIVFRHSSMYGGRQFSTYDQGWIGWFCRQALAAKADAAAEPFTISGNGKQVRDVLHADDMKRLYFAAVEHVAQAKGHAFNIGGGMENSLSLLELFAMLEELLKIKLSYTQLPVRESDQKVFVADQAKAENIFNWKPKVSKREGIEKTLEWLESLLEAGS